MGMSKFTKRVGEPAQSQEDSNMWVYGGPEIITLPPDLGGKVERVQRSFMAPCPCHEVEGPVCARAQVQWWVLESVDVAECHARGFMWLGKPSG